MSHPSFAEPNKTKEDSTASYTVFYAHAQCSLSLSWCRIPRWELYLVEYGQYCWHILL